MFCLIEIGFGESHVNFWWTTARLDLWNFPVYPVALWSSFRKAMWDYVLLPKINLLVFQLDSLCRKPVFVRICLNVLTALLSQRCRKHSLHFILKVRVWFWWLSSYGTETSMVLKIWLTIPLKVCYVFMVLQRTEELCPHVHSLIENSDWGSTSRGFN